MQYFGVKGLLGVEFWVIFGFFYCRFGGGSSPDQHLVVPAGAHLLPALHPASRGLVDVGPRPRALLLTDFQG